MRFDDLPPDVVEVVCEYIGSVDGLVSASSACHKWRDATAATIRYVLRGCVGGSALPSQLHAGQNALLRWLRTPAHVSRGKDTTKVLQLIVWAAGDALRQMHLPATRQIRALLSTSAFAARLPHLTHLSVLLGPISHQNGVEVFALSDIISRIAAAPGTRLRHVVVSREGASSHRHSRWINANTVTKIAAEAVPDQQLESLIVDDASCGAPISNVLTDLIRSHDRSLKHLAFPTL